MSENTKPSAQGVAEPREARPLNCDRDPARWAREFNDVISQQYNLQAFDEGFLIAWFSNAMMCGEDTYRWRQSASGPAPASPTSPGELLPCPHCRNSDAPRVWTKWFNPDGERSECPSYSVVCSVNANGCGAQGGHALNKERAAEKWNNRALSPLTPEAVREMCAKVCEMGYTEFNGHPTVLGARYAAAIRALDLSPLSAGEKS